MAHSSGPPVDKISKRFNLLELIMTVLSATRAELKRLGVATDCPEGAAVLALARNMDSPRTGMSVAGDSRALVTLLDELRKREVRKADTVDEVRRIREKKLKEAAAAG